MKKELLENSQVEFDSESRTFGNREGLDTISTLRELSAAVKDLQNERLHERRELFLLRTPVFAIAAHKDISKTLRDQRNSVAHGGRVLTDISLMRDMSKLHHDETVALWAEGFIHIYGVDYSYADEILGAPGELIDLLNMNANILLLREYQEHPSRSNMISKCRSIISMWKTWVDQGKPAQNNPFEREIVISTVRDLSTGYRSV